MHHPHLHGPRALALIAAFKFVKSISLIAAAIVLLRLRDPETGARLREWAGALSLDTGHQLVGRALHGLLDLSGHTITLFAAIACVYGILYGIEGLGLWWNVRWAKYLTVISTSLFIPVELWEIARHPAPLKALALAVNIVIVLYLVHLLRIEIAAEHRLGGETRSGAS